MKLKLAYILILLSLFSCKYDEIDGPSLDIQLQTIDSVMYNDDTLKIRGQSISTASLLDKFRISVGNEELFFLEDSIDANLYDIKIDTTFKAGSFTFQASINDKNGLVATEQFYYEIKSVVKPVLKIINYDTARAKLGREFNVLLEMQNGMRKAKNLSVFLDSDSLKNRIINYDIDIQNDSLRKSVPLKFSDANTYNVIFILYDERKNFTRKDLLLEIK